MLFTGLCFGTLYSTFRESSEREVYLCEMYMSRKHRFTRVLTVLLLSMKTSPLAKSVFWIVLFRAGGAVNQTRPANLLEIFSPRLLITSKLRISGKFKDPWKNIIHGTHICFNICIHTVEIVYSDIGYNDEPDIATELGPKVWPAMTKHAKQNRI